jgi:hypothetical protein
LNARRLHIKSGIGYKTGDIQQLKNQNIKTTNNASYAHTNASHVSHMSNYDFDASYVLMRNKFEKVIVLHVGPHHKRSKSCVWMSKCLVTNLKGPNQTWVPKNKD